MPVLPTHVWTPDRAARPPAWPVPPVAVAMLRGLRNECPACGQGHIFQGFLKVRGECPHCSAPLGRVRADDVPPYFTIMIVGHIVVPLMLLVERQWAPPLWLHAAIFLPLTLFLCLALLRPVKGATVGLMLRLGMVRAVGDD